MGEVQRNPGGWMDYRKLIGFGNGSYIITMPRAWVKHNKLKKGDLIALNEQGSELVLAAQESNKGSEISEITIETSGKRMERIQTEIVSAYLNGFDTINISLEGMDQDAQDAKLILRNLAGMEIFEHSSARITAKNILSLGEVSLDNLIRRMDVIIKSMIDDALSPAINGKAETALGDRDTDINRLYFLGGRTIKKAMCNPGMARALGKTPWQLHTIKLMQMRMEKIADCQKRIARLLTDCSLDRDAIISLQKLYSSFGERFGMVMKAYYQRDAQQAMEIETTNKDQIVACTEFLSEFNKKASRRRVTPSTQTAIALVVENLKNANSQLKYMARYVLTDD